MNEALVALEQLPGPLPPFEFTISLTTQLCGNFDEFSIYHWGDFNDNYKYFDYGELITIREIEDYLSIDVGVIPPLIDNIPIRDHCDINGIQAETTRILRSQIFDCDLQIRGYGSNAGPLTNMSRFLQKTRALLRRER
jgi:hypothetical protein